MVSLRDFPPKNSVLMYCLGDFTAFFSGWFLEGFFFLGTAGLVEITVENWSRQPMTWRVFFAILAAVGDDSQQTIPETTPWKINMKPENDGLEDDFPFQLGDF